MNGIDFYQVGDRHDFGTHTFTAEDIIVFGHKFDPQPFHVDAQAPRSSLFGGLCASGWHTGAVWMRKNCDYRAHEFARIAAEGGRPPVIGPSPGIRAMRWLKPVYAGDTVRFGCDITAKRASRSRPGWMIVESLNFADHIDGTRVMEFHAAILVGN